MTAIVDIMCDIETLGTKPGSAILSIGATTFSLGAPMYDYLPFGIAPWDFHRRISLASCLDHRGLTVDASTIEFWMTQSDAARAAVFADAVPLDRALGEFAMWWNEATRQAPGRPQPPVRLWAHGASFDPVLLECAFRACGRNVPWPYQRVRDTRTLFDLAGERDPTFAEAVPRQGETHDALSDARWQALVARKAYAVLRDVPLPSMAP